MRLSRPQINECVAVVSLGPIGQLSARIHALAGAKIVATDRIKQCVDLAREAGITALVSNETLTETFRDVLPQGTNVVVDATGSRAVLDHVIALAQDVRGVTRSSIGRDC